MNHDPSHTPSKTFLNLTCSQMVASPFGPWVGPPDPPVCPCVVSDSSVVSSLARKCQGADLSQAVYTMGICREKGA